MSIPTGSLWRTQPRQGHSLHRICAYQGSFPPQLPAYFLDCFPSPQTVLDPFAGRGTVLLEAVLRGKVAYGVDINPVAQALSRVKLNCPPLKDILVEIDALRLDGVAPSPPDEVKPFFHSKTWEQLWHLKNAARSPALTALVLGRLHGHSPGFFSVTTFNVVSVRGANLQKLMQKHGSTAEPRDVKAILRKAAQHFIPAMGINGCGDIFANDARNLPLPDHSVDLVITSPPFLDVIDYADVNWLRLWFLGAESPLTYIRNVAEYREFLVGCLRELARVITPQGIIVFEVGPIKRTTNLSDLVLSAANGILHVEEIITHSFVDAKVAKISRAMTGGKKTTTMTNNCIILRPKK